MSEFSADPDDDFISDREAEWRRYSESVGARIASLEVSLSSAREGNEALQAANTALFEIVNEVFEGHGSGWIIADTDLVPADVCEAFFAKVARVATRSAADEKLVATDTGRSAS